jgi:3-oxoacyl-[acyl-carrier protein] reductase
MLWSRPPWPPFGTVDIVIANAGGPPPGHALWRSTTSLLDDALNANLMSAVRLARAGDTRMRQHGWGRVCCITSYSVVQPIPTLALSNTARAGLWAWAKTAAHDLAGRGERHHPEPDLSRSPRHRPDARARVGSGVMGDPADFGAVVATFLCSRQAAFINGAAVVVDGGATLAL